LDGAEGIQEVWIVTRIWRKSAGGMSTADQEVDDLENGNKLDR